MPLLDQYGRKIELKKLNKAVAAPGISSVRKAWLESVTRHLTPSSLGKILKAADTGDAYDYLVLAEEIEEKDPHYNSVLGTRKRRISGIEPSVIPASEDKRDIEIAESVREYIAEFDGFTGLVEDLLDAIGKGYSVVEIDWEKTSKLWYPRSFIHRPAYFFQFDKETGREIRIRDEDHKEGMSLPGAKFICHMGRTKSGLPLRGGIARLVAFSWICKNYSVKDWISCVESYGMPLRIGRYGPQAKEDDVNTLYTAVANLGTDAAAVLPDHMHIEFQDIMRGSASTDIFENLARWVDEQISKAVLGQTMTADDGSSRSQADVHNDVRLDIARADAKGIKDTINRDLVCPFVDLNFGVQQAYPKINIEVLEPEDTDLVLKNVARMATLGTKFKQNEIRAKLGFSDPVEDDEIIGGMNRQNTGEDDIAKNRIDLPVSMNSNPFSPIDDLEEHMLEDWQDILGPLIEPVMDVIATATSYDEIKDRLNGIFKSSAVAPLIDRLVKSAMMARGHGDISDV